MIFILSRLSAGKFDLTVIAPFSKYRMPALTNSTKVSSSSSDRKASFKYSVRSCASCSRSACASVRISGRDLQHSSMHKQPLCINVSNC
jgi:hypothetical protein